MLSSSQRFSGTFKEMDLDSHCWLRQNKFSLATVSSLPTASCCPHNTPWNLGRQFSFFSFRGLQDAKLASVNQLTLSEITSVHFPGRSGSSCRRHHTDRNHHWPTTIYLPQTEIHIWATVRKLVHLAETLSSVTWGPSQAFFAG